MDQKAAVRSFKLLVALAAFHGEQPFKVRAYERALEALKGLEGALFDQPIEKWPPIEGIGKSLREALIEAQKTGHLGRCRVLEEKTPEGLRPLLLSRVLSPTKLGHLWRSLGIESIEALEEACTKHLVAAEKGFGEKSEARILDGITFLRAQEGYLCWDQALERADRIEAQLSELLPQLETQRTGLLARGEERLSALEWIARGSERTAVEEAIKQLEGVTYLPHYSSPWTLHGATEGTSVVIYYCGNEEVWKRRYLISSASALHLSLSSSNGCLYERVYEGCLNEETLYEDYGGALPLPLRETKNEALSAPSIAHNLVEKEDLRGVLHCHSRYSDGRDSLASMAEYVAEEGYEYLGISDHSRSAFYARGLQIEEIRRQHAEIDELNQSMTPFRVFKGIECDILPDGSLDYPNEVLASFDFVIASIHSHLQMDKAQATERLLRAISNPYTQIIGHPSGRLLLERPGYELDYEAIIKACAASGVAIEFNAHSRRLDLSWRWIPAALTAGVRISINPDAHDRIGVSEMVRGLRIAQKGGLTRGMTLNAYTRDELEAHFKRKSTHPQ